MRRQLLYIAAGLVGVATTALIAHAVLAPTVLRVAVGPVGSPNVRVVVGFLQAFQRDRANIRLKLVITDGSMASGRAVTDRKADLAVVRSDAGLPANSATAAILRRDAVFFATAPGSAITTIADLRGKTVGTLTLGSPNDRLLQTILAHYDMAPNTIMRVAANLPEMTQIIHEGGVDAVLIAAPPNDRNVRSLLQAFPKSVGNSPGLIAISDIDAIAEQDPAFESYEVPRGAFGASPALPDASFSTLSVTHRLVARRDLSESTVSELARLLSTLRLQVAQDVPAANQLEMPSTEDRAAKLPTHPGTIAYVEGETRTFFERYGDFIYIGIMAFSLLGSALAALASSIIGRKASIPPDQRLKDLVRLTQAVPEASDEELADIEHQSRHVINDLLGSLGDTDVDAGRIATISFLSNEFRRALGERRAALLPRAAE